MKHATIGKNGERIVPEEMRVRYHLEPDLPVRLGETKVGILIIPLNEPPSEEIMEELAAWQRLGLANWEQYGPICSAARIRIPPRGTVNFAARGAATAPLRMPVRTRFPRPVQ